MDMSDEPLIEQEKSDPALGFKVRCLRLGLSEVTRLINSKKLNIQSPKQLIVELQKLIIGYENTLAAVMDDDRRSAVLGASDSKIILAHLERAQVVAAQQKAHIAKIIEVVCEEFKDELKN